MNITTKDDLMEYILRKLGSPIVEVEITEDQLDDIISEVIQEFTKHAMDGELTKFFIIETTKDIKKYKVDNRINTILDLKLSSQSKFGIPGEFTISQSDYLFKAIYGNGQFDISSAMEYAGKMEVIDKYFGIIPNWTYNENSKTLELFDKVGNGSIMILASTDYEINEDEDFIFNHIWVKKMAVAKAKIQWARNISKFSTSLINGATLNYDMIKNEGETEIEKATEELYETWSEPLGLYIG